MKNLADEFKAIRSSEDKACPTLEELEEALVAGKNDELRNAKIPFASIKRLLPECYKHTKPGAISISLLHDETLFYVFYNLTESKLQVQAYNELLKRGYFYSLALDRFVIFNCPKIEDSKRKAITVFQPLEWKKEVVEVVFTENFVNTLEGALIDE